MKLFVATPFSPEYQPIYQTIQEASAKFDLASIRGDELCRPGPIIQHIDARVVDSKYLSKTEGYLITIADGFEDRVVFSVDSNGNIRRKKRLVN